MAVRWAARRGRLDEPHAEMRLQQAKSSCARTGFGR